MLAAESDFEAIYQIWLEGIDNSFDKNAVAPDILWERFLANFNFRSGIFNYWVAELNGRILGWQSLVRGSYNPFRMGTTAESSTYIAKSCRLKGMGEALIAHVMAEAEIRQLEYVFAFVAVENVPARKITRNTGWIEVGEMPSPLKNKNAMPKLFMVRPV